MTKDKEGWSSLVLGTPEDIKQKLAENPNYFIDSLVESLEARIKRLDETPLWFYLFDFPRSAE